jgi:hypothetical protein
MEIVVFRVNKQNERRTAVVQDSTRDVGPRPTPKLHVL